MDLQDAVVIRSVGFARWKSFLTWGLALLTFAAPFWLWRADLNSHSLSARLTSSVALQVAATTTIPDMQVSIGGQPVVSPYLSTIVLTNDGLKPIVASDFESPLEFATNAGADVVRATVSAISPSDLRGAIVMEKQVVKLKPILLNPGDSLQFTVITTGKQPAFSPRARIAGVSKIVLEDETKKKDKGQAVNLVLYVFTLIVYPIFLYSFIHPFAFRSPKGLALCGLIVTSILSAILSFRVFEWIGIQRTSFLAIAVVILVGAPIVFYLTYRHRRGQVSTA